MTDIQGERARLAAQGLDIIYRETWGARQSYTSARAVQWPALYLFLHITVTTAPAPTLASESAACQQVEAIGQSRFGIGWSYNAGVMQSGRLYEGQPLTRRGAHTVNDKPNLSFPSGSLNEEARACALVQNVDDAVTDAQIDAAARWGAALRRSGEARMDAHWYGHRDVTAKSCPGPIGYARLPELNRLTDHYTANGLTPKPEEEEDDMPYLLRNNQNGAIYLIDPATGPVHLINQATAEDYSAKFKTVNMRIGSDADWIVARAAQVMNADLDAAADLDAIRTDLADEEPGLIPPG